MKRSHGQLFVVFLALSLLWSGLASAQVGLDPLDLRQRLIEAKDDQYVGARDEALALPKGAFDDLLFLLRLTPEYSLERTLALILEARVKHPEEAERFDGELRKMVENPSFDTVDGGPRYHLWTNRERLAKEKHPFIFEALIKLELPGDVRVSIANLSSMPNPDNVPFILYFAKHHGAGALGRLVRVTEGYPKEREWLRPLAVEIYKTDRLQGKVRGMSAVAAMFRSFGTPEDLSILKELREFEQELMPAQGFVLGDRDEIGRAWYDATTEYEQKRIALERAEREGAPTAVIQARQLELEDAEAIAREATRQKNGEFLWRQLNEEIDRLETRLAQQQE